MTIDAIVRLVVAASVAVVVGCHDKDEDPAGLSSEVATPGPPVTTLEYYQDSQGTLFAVPPSAPGSDFLVDANATEGAFPILGDNCNDGIPQGSHVETVLYSRNDGTLQRVSTDPDTTPVPTQVSSETAASPVCDAKIGHDFVNHENTRLAYELAGSDCAQAPDWKVVNLGDDSVTQPRNFPGVPVTALIDTGDGTHTGWLTVANGQLRRLDANENFATGDLIAVNNFAESLGALLNGVLFLNIDGGLHAFDPGANSLTSLGFSFTGDNNLNTDRPQGTGSDGTELFFVDGQRLLRTDIASSSVILIDEPADASQFSSFSALQVGPERVVWSFTRQEPESQAVDVLRTVNKSANGTGSARDLDVAEGGSFNLAFFFTGSTATDWAFYTFVDSDTGNPTAIAKLMDGSQEERFSDALWLGSGLSPSIIGGSRAQSKIYRLDNIDTTFVFQPGAGQGGGSLKSVAPNDPGAPAIDLGLLPNDVVISILLPGFGSDRLGAVLTDDGSGGFESDIIYFNETEPGTLQRLTDTDTEDETPVVLF